MVKRGNKTGQFYLISAVILAMLVVGVFTISNYLRKESNVKLEYLKEEIKTESEYVLDYSSFNQLSNTNLYILLSSFTKDYIDKEKDKDLYFVFGDHDNITVTGYQKTPKQVSVSSGSSVIITEEAGEFTGGINPSMPTLTLSIGNTPYLFELNNGKNFYFILSQKINKGEYIIIG